MDDGTHDRSDEDWSEDPGWHLDWRVLVMALPGGLQWQLRRSRGDHLVELRNVFVAFVSAIVLFGVVLIFIRSPQQGSTLEYLLPLLGIAAVTLIVPRLVERPLNCGSDFSLAGSYRTRFFLRIAFAESVALFAFVFSFLGGPRWIYYLGAGITLVRMATQAPTPAALVREQDDLAARGCTRSLVAAIRRTPPK